MSDINLGAAMDGFAFAAAWRRRWPTVPMLTMSGWEINFAGRRCGEGERLVTKPFVLDAFVQHASQPGSE